MISLRHPWLWASAVAFGVMTSACRSEPTFERLSVANARLAPTGGSVTASSVTVDEGLSVAAQFDAYDSDGEAMPIDALESVASTIAEVFRAPDNRWVFLGKQVGNTQVRVVSRGEAVTLIQVTVTPQRR